MGGRKRVCDTPKPQYQRLLYSGFLSIDQKVDSQQFRVGVDLVDLAETIGQIQQLLVTAMTSSSTSFWVFLVAFLSDLADSVVISACFPFDSSLPVVSEGHGFVGKRK